MNAPDLRAELAWVWDVDALADALDAPLRCEHLLWLRACRGDEALLWSRLLDLVYADRQRAHRHHVTGALACHYAAADLVAERLHRVFVETGADGRPGFMSYRGKTVREFRGWLYRVISRYIGRLGRKYGERRKLETEKPGAADWVVDPAVGCGGEKEIIEHVDRIRLTEPPPLPPTLLELARWLYTERTLAAFARLKQITYDQARGWRARLRRAVSRLSAEARYRLRLYLERSAA